MINELKENMNRKLNSIRKTTHEQNEDINKMKELFLKRT